MAETIRHALKLLIAIQNQYDAGFKELVVRNPKSKKEKEIVLTI